MGTEKNLCHYCWIFFVLTYLIDPTLIDSRIIVALKIIFAMISRHNI